ncbi:MAG: DUF2007 domain-containing protein [Salinivirgaceae bacterium]|jgi:hypothetical protein
MSADWKTVYSTGKLYQAEMAKFILEENDIETVLLNQQDSFYLFGAIELLVKPEHVIRAKYLLKDL